TDFYDARHTNIKGAIKYTNYFGKYLLDNYHLEDHRGDDRYSSWDESYKKYIEIVNSYFKDPLLQ
ncbi:MAG: hypothetical protein ACOX8Q_08505, partial [Christensenellales bacterium]